MRVVIRELRRFAGLIPYFAAPQGGLAAGALALGGGLLGYFGAKNQPKTLTSTNTTTYDPTTNAFRNNILNSTQAAAAGGIPPAIQQALSQYGGLAGLGLQGQAALGGDQSALGGFLNPYNQNVVNATGSYFDKLRSDAAQNINARAAAAGAFGGSRQGVALGRTFGDLYSQQGQTVAGLQQQGFENAMQRAQAAAQGGFNAAGQLSALGNWTDPNLRALSIWQQGLQGLPLGTTQTITNPNPNKQNPWLAAAGGALAGFQAGGGGGKGGGGSPAGSIWSWGGPGGNPA
jgi:hypothetical protein